MYDRQQIGMQGLSSKGRQRALRLLAQPRRLGAIAGGISLIAEQRVTDMGEVDADLMGPASLQPAVEQARDRQVLIFAVPAGVGLQQVPMGDRLTAALAHRALVACTGVPVERRVDRAASP